VHDTAAKPRPQGHAEEILIAFGAAGFFEEAVDVGQEAGDGFAIHEEVAVVVDESRDTKLRLQHRPEGNPTTEAGQVAQVPDNPVRVIRRSWEDKADGHRRFRALLLNAGEALDDIGEAFSQIVPIGWQGDGLGDRLVAADGGEAEIGSARVERHDDAFISVRFHEAEVGKW